LEARSFALRPRAVALALVTTLLALTAGAGVASADVGPKLLAPGNGKVLARGSQPIFKARDVGDAFNGRVWLTISSSKQRDKNGKLKQAKFGTFTNMKRGKNHTYTYKPPAYTFDSWFMQRPGTYYWQAYHINCHVRGCNVFSKVRRFVVR
jgi:hypothetical protein